MNNNFFTLVSPQNRTLHQHELEQLNQKYAYEYGNSLFELKDEDDQNQYLICRHEKYGIIGGAVLSHSENQKTELNDYFLHNGFKIHNFWQVSNIFISLAEIEEIQEDEEAFKNLCKQFYKSLEQELRSIGARQKASTWFILNSVDEHENTKYFGGWAYAAEHLLNINRNSDSLVLGLLEVA